MNINKYLTSAGDMLKRLGADWQRVYTVTDKQADAVHHLDLSMQRYGQRAVLNTQVSDKLGSKIMAVAKNTSMTAEAMGSLAYQMETGMTGYRFLGDAIGDLWGKMDRWQKLMVVTKHPLAMLGKGLRELVQHPLQAVGMAMDAVQSAFHKLRSILDVTGLGGLFSVKQAIQDSIEYQSRMMKMSAMFGSKSFGAKMTAWTYDVRTQLALTEDEVSGYVQNVNKFGLRPATQDLKTIQGLALRTGQDFNSVMGTVMQLSDPRTGMAANLGEISDALANKVPWGKLAELQQQLTSIGGFDIRAREKVIVDFFKSYSKYADQFAATPEGMISRFKASIKKISVSLGEGIMKSLKPMMDSLVKWLNDPKNMARLKKIGFVIGDVIGGAIKALGGFFTTLFGTNLLESSKNLDDFYKNKIAPFITSMYLWGQETAIWIKQKLIPALKGIWSVVEPMGKAFGTVIGVVAKPIVWALSKNAEVTIWLLVAGACALNGNYALMILALIKAGYEATFQPVQDVLAKNHIWDTKSDKSQRAGQMASVLTAGYSNISASKSDVEKSLISSKVDMPVLSSEGTTADQLESFVSELKAKDPETFKAIFGGGVYTPRPTPAPTPVAGQMTEEQAKQTASQYELNKNHELIFHGATINVVVPSNITNQEEMRKWFVQMITRSAKAKGQ